MTISMTQRILTLSLGVALALGGLAGSKALAADDYPSKPIRLIVAYAPGGANDIIARLYAQELSEILNGNIVVENRAGASGIPGTQAASRADPDGYTLLVGPGSTMSINPILFKDLSYNPDTDFQPIGLLARSPLVLVVPPDLPVNSVQELITWSKAQPEAVTFASPGTGTPLHLAGEWFSEAADLPMLHVPYKGSGPALNDLMAGRTHMMFDVTGSSMEFVRGGKLKALAVSSQDRSPQLPDVPTVAEQGIEDFDVSVWFGLFVPAGTPSEIVEKLSAATQEATRSTRVSERLMPMGMVPASSTPEELRTLMTEERERWAGLAGSIGLEGQ